MGDSVQGSQTGVWEEGFPPGGKGEQTRGSAARVLTSLGKPEAGTERSACAVVGGTVTPPPCDLLEARGAGI